VIAPVIAPRVAAKVIAPVAAKVIAPVIASRVAAKVIAPVAAKVIAQTGFKVYGNYCGPNYCGGQRFAGAEGPSCLWGVMPKDPLDACCKVHDQCCGLNRSTSCNKEILSCLNKVKCEGTQCKVAQLAMKTTFVVMQNRVCGDLITPTAPRTAPRSTRSKDVVIGSVNNMHDRVVSIIHETQIMQKREIVRINKNVDFSQNDMDNFIMKQDDEEKQLQQLQASILRVNASIARHYAQMNADSLYLHKLDLIRPQFLQTLDATNANFAALSNHVSNLMNDEHKKAMQEILTRAQNQTVYDTRDLAQAFLAHYEKYKHVLRTDSAGYDQDIVHLKELNQRYAYGQTVFSGLKAEVARLRDLVAALKKSVSASEAEAAMFAQLEQIISAILSAKKTRFAIDGVNKECAVSILKSHVANGLV
jgi:hypothetical protein